MIQTCATELTALKLTTALSNRTEDSPPSEILASLIADLNPDEAGAVIGAIVNTSCLRLDAAIVFLSLLDRASLITIIPDWNWNRFDGWFSGTSMGAVWEAFDRLDAPSKRAVTAKVSLLIEINYILRTESTSKQENGEGRTGADLALQILKGHDPGSRFLEVVLAAYPLEVRSSLRGVLSELDFIEENVGRLRYAFSDSAIEEAARGG